MKILCVFPGMKSFKIESRLLSGRRQTFILAGLLVAATLPALPANLQWTTNSGAISDGPGTWNQGSASVTTGSGAWYNGTSYGDTMQSGDNVTFGGGPAGAAGTITIGTGGVSPKNITLTNANGAKGYTLGNAGDPAITMTGGWITNTGSGGPTINCPLNGSFACANSGGTLALAGNGNQTANNSVTLAAGTFQIGNNGNSGSLGAAVITNNSALQWKRNNQAIVNISNAVYGTGGVKFIGSGATYIVYSNLFYTGATALQMNASNSPNNLFQLGGSNVLPTNTALSFVQLAFNGSLPTNSQIWDLNGFNQTVGSLAGDQFAVATSEVVTNSSATPVTLTVSGTSKTGYGGLIGGNLSLMLTGGGGLLTLSNTASTYTGSTTISNGTLRLNGSGAIVSPVINLAASAATLDVSTVTGGYSLGSGQTLGGVGVVTGAVTTVAGSVIAPGNAGSVGTLSFSNNLTLNGNLVFKLNKSLAQSNDIVNVLGVISNGGTGTLTVNNLGPVPAAGDKFKLFGSAVGSGGTLTVTSPAGTVFTNNLAVDGSITVLTPHANTNASLASLALTPGTLAPAFTAGEFNYSVTNSFGQTPAVTVVDTDPTATNTLFYNGVSQGALASGVPSGSLALSVGTNVVQVQVTAQDGVTTNLYTVNLIELPRNLTWTTNAGGIYDGSGTWNQGSASLTAGSGAWFDGTNYGTAMQSGDNVIFGGGTLGAAGTITNGTGLNPANITILAPNGGGYTIGTNGLGVPGNPITMSGGLITNNTSAGSAIFACPVNGSFTYAGPNRYVVIANNGNQTPANNVTVNPGSLLQIGNNTAAGSLGQAIITNNGTINVKRSGSVMWSNVVYGAGGMKFWGNGATFVVLSNLFYGGTTTLQPASASSTNTLVQLGGSNVLPTNSALIIAQNSTAPTGSQIFDLNGFNQTVGSLASDQYASGTSEVVTNSSATPATLSSGGTSLTTYGGMIGGNLSLALNGGMLILSNTADTFTGNTLINAGTLALTGGASLTNSGAIVVAGGATFNVAGLSSVFTLAGARSSQTLSNSSVRAVINGTNNCSAGIVSLVFDAANPSFILTNGGMTLSGGSVLQINNTGSALSPGSYLIISNVTSGNAGFVGGSAPSAVTVNGGGIISGTVASLQLGGAGLSLVVAKGNQAIGFTNGPITLAKTYGSAPFADAATNSSGLSLSYSSDNNAVATVNAAGSVTIVSVGTCHIAATNSGGTGYNPVSASQTLTVNPLSVIVSGTRAYDGTATATNAILSITNLAGTDNFTVSGYAGLAGANAGTNAITGTGNLILPGTGRATNYTLAGAGGYVVITNATPAVQLAASIPGTNGYLAGLTFTSTLPAFVASGNVVFLANGTAFGTNAITNGVAGSLVITNLPRGTNTINVQFAGDLPNVLGSTNSLFQIVTNHPPVAGVMAVTRTAGLGAEIALSDLATNWSDPDGDAVGLSAINFTTTNGATLFPIGLATNSDGSYVVANSAYLGYANTSNVPDQISYSISDGFGGTNIGYINITAVTEVTGTNSITAITVGSSNVVTAYGVPGFSYITERSTNLTAGVWVRISTNTTAMNGVISVTDAFADLGGAAPATAFYRLLWQP